MLQEQNTPTANGDLPLIKKDPRLTATINMRTVGFWLVGIWVVLMVGLIVGRITNIRIPIPSYISPYISVILSLPIYGAIGAFALPLTALSAYKKIEQKRQAAARGEQLLPANHQLVPGEQTVSLPLIIRYQPLGMSLPMLWILALLLVLGIGENIWLGFSPLFAIAIIIAIIAYCWAFIMAKRRGRQELVADETGLTRNFLSSGKTQHIPWSEARLFAIETIANEARLKVQKPRLFELASQQEVILWPGSGREAQSWTQQGLVASQGIKPEVTDEQYEQQLQDLHALIVQKTGLLLNDLRK